METFKIREYGRTELAQLYCPGIAPESAWKKLRRWIGFVPGLEKRMAATGYNKKCRSFTPAQVRMIVDALGSPYD